MLAILMFTTSLLATVPTLVREQRDELRYLPDDLCVDLTLIKYVAVPGCADYFIVNPRTGAYAPFPLPNVIDYELAYIVNGLIMLEKIWLRKKSSSQ